MGDASTPPTFSWDPHTGADLASYVGLLLTLVGFIATFITIARARNAVKREISRLRTIHGLSSVRMLISDIKRLILLTPSTGDRALLPQRCVDLRNILIDVQDGLADDDKDKVQPLILHLTLLENAEVALVHKKMNYDSAAFFPQLNQHLDTVLRVLAQVMKGNE